MPWHKYQLSILENEHSCSLELLLQWPC